MVAEFGDGTAERAAEIERFCKRTAADVGLAERVAGFLFDDRAISQSDRDDILFVLSWLSGPLTSFLLTGHYSAFSDLPLEQRVEVLRGWGTSMLEKKRLLHKVFKLICFRFYLGEPFLSLEGGKKLNPSWPALQYSGPDPELESGTKYQEQLPHMYDFTMLDGEKENGRQFDAIVVGSGCGGGLMAAELSAAGYRVLVIDKGPYVHPRDFSLLELESQEKMFEMQGTLGTADGGMAILAGSCFGGGSTINWCCSLQTPGHVRKEWAALGLPHFLSKDYQASLDAICARVNVTDEGIVHNGQNEILIRGCKKLGYAWKVAPQNIRPAASSSHSCGWCSMGCKYGEKQGTMATYLRDAAATGAKFIDKCYVTRVTTGKSPSGKSAATGVEALWTRADGTKVPLTFHAPLVAVASGAIHTPLLLRRSGLRNQWIGHNLRLHPVTAAFGVFRERVLPWKGAIMTAVSCEPELGVDSDHYGAKLECPSLHPGLGGCVLPWGSPFQSKRSLLAFPHTSTIIVLGRDSGSGYVSEKDGRPVVDYTVSSKDSASMMVALRQACEILIAAGALRIGVPMNGIEEFVCNPELTTTDPAFHAWWKKVEEIGTKTNQCGLFSAHQMGTARLGPSPSKGALRPDGCTWEVDNLYVCDASTFPTPSGTNPMVTIFAISHSIAQTILKSSSAPPRQAKL